jgi:hypothetical protein
MVGKRTADRSHRQIESPSDVLYRDHAGCSRQCRILASA